MTENPQILVYFTNQPDEIVGGDALCLYIRDIDQRERMMVEMARLFEAGITYLPNGDAMIVTGA
jgi:hypothetical protein